MVNKTVANVNIKQQLVLKGYSITCFRDLFVLLKFFLGTRRFLITIPFFWYFLQK
jgi:hypothetical protein